VRSADPTLEMNLLRTKCEQLQQALRSGATVNQAKGLIMAIERCTPDEASHALTRMSQRSKVSIRDVAAGLVHAASRRE
jgi:AmiR/NasT family two-component response regulator